MPWSGGVDWSVVDSPAAAIPETTHKTVHMPVPYAGFTRCISEV